MRLTPIGLALVALAAPALRAQVRDVPGRGVDLRAELVQTPAWSLEELTGGFLNRRAAFDAGPMLGLRAGVSPIPQFGVFGAAQWNGGGFGDTSGFTLIEGGLEGRLPLGLALVPRVVGTVGRVSESGGVWFSYWSAGAGADWFLSRRLSLGLEVRRIDPLSAGTDRGGATATVDAGMTRLHVGVALHLPVW